MEVFYSDDIRDGRIRLSPEESAHCVKVLRHRVGDEVYVSGGDGNLYRCCLEEADSRAAVVRVLSAGCSRSRAASGRIPTGCGWLWLRRKI